MHFHIVKKPHKGPIVNLPVPIIFLPHHQSPCPQETIPCNVKVDARPSPMAKLKRTSVERSQIGVFWHRANVCAVFFTFDRKAERSLSR